MKWQSFILGASIGIIGGYAAKEVLSQKRKRSPEQALEYVKKQFKKHGPISGSWIHLEPEPYEKGFIHYSVYKGGISKSDNGSNKQYEFLVDAASGTILEVNPL